MANPNSRRRIWLFRLGAVALGLAPLLLAELLCVAFDWGRPRLEYDPFVGFSSIQPLFELTDDGRWYEIAPARRDFFAPDAFAAEKGEHEFRIFCLGGSTVQGRPYSIPTAFSTWLEIALNEADGSRDWQAVNCGGISYASYRLEPILEEVLQYQPDLIVLCTGHNEFLEDRTYGHIRRTPRALERPLRFLSQRRVFTLLREFVAGDSRRAAESADRPTLTTEVDAMLDYRNGLAAYHRDDAWRAGVIEHFEFSVRRMIALCQEADVPLILITPPSNLADQPPFKSEHRAGLTAAELDEFDTLVTEAQSSYRTDVVRSVELLKQALAIDDRMASAWFELGKCLETLNQHEEAREAFVRARDEDICPLRMLSSLEEIVSRVADEEGIPHLDAHALLEADAPPGILGDGRLVDHVHPAPEGHQAIARAILEIMTEHNLVRPDADWRSAAERAFQAHDASLPDFYFLKEQRTIDSLRAWTRGEADGPQAEDRFPHRIRE
jgi:lysophospholipase L1-like esterase